MHTIWRHGRQLQDKLGIPREDQFSPHNLRHSAATNLALAGVPPLIIQKQLNHSSLEMTMHYINAAMLLDRWLDRGRRVGDVAVQRACLSHRFHLLGTCFNSCFMD